MPRDRINIRPRKTLKKIGRTIYVIGFGKIKLEMIRKISMLVIKVLGQNLAAEPHLYQNLSPPLATPI
jgi:hypothetical protein